MVALIVFFDVLKWAVQSSECPLKAKSLDFSCLSFQNAVFIFAASLAASFILTNLNFPFSFGSMLQQFGALLGCHFIVENVSLVLSLLKALAVEISTCWVHKIVTLLDKREDKISDQNFISRLVIKQRQMLLALN